MSWNFASKFRHRRKKKDARAGTSPEFQDLNYALKDRRKIISDLTTQVESFHRASEDYFSKCRKFGEFLHDVIQQEDIDFGENDFVEAFQQGTMRTIQLFQAMVRNLTHGILHPLQARIKQKDDRAKELKRRSYNMLYERNALGAKVQSLSAAKKKLESNTAKLLVTKEAHWKASAQFSSAEARATAAMRAVDEDCSTTIVEMAYQLTKTLHMALDDARTCLGPAVACGPTLQESIAARRSMEKELEKEVQSGAESSSEMLATSGNIANDAEAVTKHIKTLSEPPVIPLLPGEISLFQAPKVMLLGANVTTVCTLLVTNYRLALLVWRPRTPAMAPAASGAWGELSVGGDAGVLSIPLMSVARIQAVSDMAGAKGKLLSVWCRNLSVLVFNFECSSMNIPEFIDALNPVLWGLPDEANSAINFPFIHSRAQVERSIDGWTLFTVEKDLLHMNTLKHLWRVSSVNNSFSLCPTYPSALLMPSDVTDDLLRDGSKYRSKRRIPAVSWVHGTVLLARAAQPLAGLFNQRSEADETLIRLLFPRQATGHKRAWEADYDAWRKGEYATQLVIYDARPRLNSIANRTKGGGTEQKKKYPGCDHQYLSIDNIHVVRNALDALKAMVSHKSVTAHHSALSPTMSKRSVNRGPQASRKLSATDDSSPPSSPSLQPARASVVSAPALFLEKKESSATHFPTAGAVEKKEGESDAGPDDSDDGSDAVADASSLLQAAPPPQPVSEATQAEGFSLPCMLPYSPLAAALGLCGAACAVHAAAGIIAAGKWRRPAPVASPLLSPARPRTLSTPLSATPVRGTAAAAATTPERHGGSLTDASGSRLAPLAQPETLPGLSKKDVEWLRLLQILLQGAVRVVKSLMAGQSVLVHCSDGWDRTAQLVSLTELIVDPYYRTLPGFCHVIQKEWCNFGFKFGRRCGTGAERENFHDSQRSPIFQQFLDAVWQLRRQYPTAFEFNDNFLEFLSEMVYAGRFGTFLCDCEREREEAQLPSKTESMWTHVLQEPGEYVNPSYAPYPHPTEAAPAAVATDPDGALRLQASTSLLESAVVPDTSFEALDVWTLYLKTWR